MSNDEKMMSKQEMVEYLKTTKQYSNGESTYYEEQMMDSNKTLPINELVERFISIDKEYENESWNIMQILANIHILIPLEDRKGK